MQQCEERIINHMHHREEEERDKYVNCNGIHRPGNLAHAFDKVGNTQVCKTPSANIDIAITRLDRLLESLEVIKDHLKAAMVPTNE